MLASGSGANEYLKRVEPLGAKVQVVSQVPGQAAARKLLRSVMMKGLAAVIVEAMQAASADNCGTWLWQNICEEIRAADEMFVERLVKGTDLHATRRLHEMEAASAYLLELGIEPNMTRSTVASLKEIVVNGFPAFD
jgi:3-hydroxyisobutyrate dehydrogenase-like beta-hydroxyacid dehydrogenase